MSSETRTISGIVIMQNLTTAEREKHIKSVFHGLELECFKIDTEERELAQMYIDGKISLVDFKTIRFKQLGVRSYTEKIEFNLEQQE